MVGMYDGVDARARLEPQSGAVGCAEVCFDGRGGDGQGWGEGGRRGVI